MHKNNSLRYLVLTTIALFIISIGYSAHARAVALTPKSVCYYLQSRNLIRSCEDGTPWAFEVVRHQKQFMFEATEPTLFECYKASAGRTNVGCIFKGAITQFSSQKELHKGLLHIRAQNYNEHTPADLAAEIVRADTTLEQYIFYKSELYDLLVIVTRTERMPPMLHALDALGLIEVDE